MKTIATLTLAFGLACAARAQGLMGFANFTDQAVGDGTYNYTLTLHNTGSTAINNFWFAWLPSGENLLYSMPTAISSQDGYWMGYVNAGYYGGYSIDFTTYYTPLAPGSTLDFSFNSADSPDALQGTSYYYNGPVGTSYIYDASYNSFAFVVQPVPEPSVSALLATGFFAFTLLRRRHPTSK